LGTLAAVAGSVKMLAHFLLAARSGGRGGGTIGFKQIFDNAQNVLPPVAWQLADLFKHTAGFSDRAAASRCFVAAQESVSGYVERAGQGVNLLGSQGNRFAFPIRNHALGDINFFGQFLLGETGRLARLGNPLTQGGAWF